MSVKINKNGKEYPIGVIPQNVIDDVTALKNKYAVIEDYTPSTTGGTKTLSFPTGFTMTNSVIVTIGLNLGNIVFTSAVTGNYLYAMYKSDGTGITLGLTNEAPSGATSKAVKVVLMKIS